MPEIHKPKNLKGMTLIEIVLAVAVILIISGAGLLAINPAEKRANARDTVRISDIETIERAVQEYLMDNGSYPDLAGTIRESVTLPTGNTSLDNSASGWIDTDLSKYMSRMPIDPINDATYKYSYYHTTSTYEINAVLEDITNLMLDDGGNDANVYEVGNDLTLISP